MNRKILTIEDIKQFAMESLSKASGSHGWDHTCRVYNICKHIGRVEKADMEVLETAAYLHDVGRPLEDESKGHICHARKGSEIAARLLKNFPISEGQKDNIIQSIRTHRFRGNKKPKSLEAKILYDADKLDAIGAIGIARAFHFAGEVGAKLHSPNVDLEKTEPYTEDDTGYREFRLKLSKIKDRMLTSEGRRIAKERGEFMEIFFKKFISEFKGYG